MDLAKTFNPITKAIAAISSKREKKEANKQLISAIKEQNISDVLNALKNDANPNQKGGFKRKKDHVPLSLALHGNDVGIFKALLKNGAKADKEHYYELREDPSNKSNYTVVSYLMAAIEQDKEDMALALVSTPGVDVKFSGRIRSFLSLESHDEKQPLQMAREAGMERLTRALEKRLRNEAFNTIAKANATAAIASKGKKNLADKQLLSAIKEQNISNVLNALKNGANPNKGGIFGRLPLQFALRGNDVDIFKALLEGGAKADKNNCYELREDAPNEKEYLTVSYLMAAIEQGKEGMALALIGNPSVDLDFSGKVFSLEKGFKRNYEIKPLEMAHERGMEELTMAIEFLEKVQDNIIKQQQAPRSTPPSLR